MNWENPLLGNKYAIYTVMSIKSPLIKDGYLNAQLEVVDDATQRILMRVGLRAPFCRIGQFLNLNKGAQGQDISNRLIGKKFFEPGKDFWEGIKEGGIDERLIAGLADQNKAVGLEKYIQYEGAYPAMGFFESFREEKQLRGDYSALLCGFHWRRVYEPQNTFNGIDPGIVELVRDLNRVEFVYTKGESCSGIPKDHEGRYVDNAKPAFGFEKGKKGFIILRVDSQDPRFLPFSRGLQSLCDVELIKIGYDDHEECYQRQNGIKNLAMLIPVPQSIASNPNHSHYEDYMSNRWNKVHEVVKIFIEPTEVEQIKESILKERQRRISQQREEIERWKYVMRRERRK